VFSMILVMAMASERIVDYQPLLHVVGINDAVLAESVETNPRATGHSTMDRSTGISGKSFVMTTRTIAVLVDQRPSGYG
jgi:hypothetical protein